MATSKATASETGEAQAEKPAVKTWDPDPLVVVSARTRNISIPRVCLSRDLSDVDVARLGGMAATNRNEKSLTLLAGVTFLGALTTSWALRSTQPGNAPRGAPPVDACRLILPPYSDADALLKSKEVTDPNTGRPDADKVAACWVRAMDYLRTQERLCEASESPPSCLLFTPQDGAQAPEVIVVRLSEVLGQTTTEGRQAYAYVSRAIRHSKNGLHLGALHDYAVRNHAASSIMDDCRRRATACPPAFSAGT